MSAPITPGDLQSLSEAVQTWAQMRPTLQAPAVAAALVEIAAQNCVQYEVTRRDWRDQCAAAFDRAVRFVKRDNPMMLG